MNQNQIQPAVGTVRFFGRCVTLPGAGETFFNWSGAGFAFTFTGTEVSAYLLAGVNGEEPPAAGERAYLGVFVDGIPLQTARFSIDRAEGWYLLAEQLPFGTHTVRVVKQTEVGNGRAAVRELSTDGEFLPPPDAPKLKLECIGDSMTCGYGDVCSNESPEFVTREENFSLTYAAQAAGMLGADLSCIAASGNGFYHDCGFGTHNLIPVLYGCADKMLHEHCGLPAEKWDFAADPRDAVIIKLGQNDERYCMCADLPEAEQSAELISKRRAEFVISAAEFLKQIKASRPGTPIILLYETEMYLRAEVCAAAEQAGGITLLGVRPKQIPYEGAGANGHWAVPTHTRVAAELAAKLKEVLCLQ